MNKLDIRSYSWGQGQLSWAYVIARICSAFEKLGHNVHFISTNGLSDSDPCLTEDKMIKSIIELQKFGLYKKSIDIDLCYTVPSNFPQRFLPNSKHKC